MKGVRTGTQVASFYETGSVTRTNSDLGTLNRSNYGIGLRLVTASGFVYRPEVALWEEGQLPASHSTIPGNQWIGRDSRRR